MPMLDASDPAFQALYPHFAQVFDATGRQLHNVVACDPLTGEAVMVDLRPSLWDQLTLPLRRQRLRWWRHLAYRTSIPRRHGFWPAPLRIVPNPAPEVGS